MPPHRRPQKKSDAHLGFERMLNTPEASPLTNPVIFQNVIKASGDGKVKKIHALKGHAVEKNQLLIEFE